MVVFVMGCELFEVFVGGQFDFVFMVDFLVVVGVMCNQKFGVIVDFSCYIGNCFIVKVSVIELKSLLDFVGKKVGFMIGINYNYFVSCVLSKVGVKVQFVNVGFGDFVVVLLCGDIDVVVFFLIFYGMVQKIFGVDYCDFISIDYMLYNIMIVLDGVLIKKLVVVEKFLSVLLKVDQIVKIDLEIVLIVVVLNFLGVMMFVVIKGMWLDYMFGIVFDESLFDLLIDEGVWVVEIGVVKGSVFIKVVMRGYLVDVVFRKFNLLVVNLL